MARRAALLISSSMEEARLIRERARIQRRGISSYMLNIAMRAVQFEENLISRDPTLRRFLYDAAIRVPGPRTAILLRCSKDESERIRRVAQIRGVTISGLVLYSIRRSWEIQQNLIQRYFGR